MNQSPDPVQPSCYLVKVISQTCLTKFVPDVRLVLQRFPLVCVIVRRDFLGLTGANRVTLRSF